MMKLSGLLTIIICCCCFASLAQKEKIFTVPAGATIEEAIPIHEIYRYPTFVTGHVTFKNGSAVTAPFNYNYFDREMKFISSNGDTMDIANGSEINSIAINSDTFYFSNQGYLRKLTANSFIKLAVLQGMKEMGKEQMSSYGQSTSTASTTNYSALDKNNSLLNRISQKFTINYARGQQYFISDTSNNFQVLNKKNLLKLYSKSENEVANYLKSNDVNFNKEEDLQKLIAFLQKVQN